MKTLAIILVLMVGLGPQQALAKNCTSGCACGNTCIDCSDECREEDQVSDAENMRNIGIVFLIFLAGCGLVALARNASQPRGVPDTIYTEENPPPVGGWINETSGGVSLGLAW